MSTFYIILVSNIFTVLFLFLIVRPIYEARLARKIKADISKNVMAALEHLRVDFKSKLARDIKKLREDMRRDDALGRIVQTTMIQKRGKDG